MLKLRQLKHILTQMLSFVTVQKDYILKVYKIISKRLYFVTSCQYMDNPQI